jgi:hypothetical protein
MERQCLECGEVVRGRSDKKFCSSDCRSSYNNKSNSDSTNLMRRVNGVLRKNYRILKELAPDGKAKIHRNKLEEYAFNFKYFTSVYTTKAGKEYRFCYDYGYLDLENDYYVVVQNKDKE